MDKNFLEQIDKALDLFAVEEKLSDEILICECFSIDAADIRRACAHDGNVNLDVLNTDLCLGQGCQTCLKRSETWINKIF